MNWKLAREIEQDMGPMDIREANLAQRRQLLRTAPVKDLEDLIPILAERCRVTREAARQAEEELAEALLMSEAKKEAARG